ncbi:nischarin-like [Betta splendens]|uniref:Nischarin-like n=1 Tax=Betta splendens TaxID=158456 RepID=A0A8M1H7A9_BETSP|nr:nischarin-like [Betta splendens]
MATSIDSTSSNSMAAIHTAKRLPTYTATRAVEGKLVALLSSTPASNNSKAAAVAPALGDREATAVAPAVAPALGDREAAAVAPALGDREAAAVAPALGDREAAAVAPALGDREAAAVAPALGDREAAAVAPALGDREAVTPALRDAAVFTANRLPTYIATGAMEGKLVALLSSTPAPNNSKATITSHPEPSDREAITAHPEPSDREAITFPAHRAAAVIHTGNKLPTYIATRAMEGKLVALLSSTPAPNNSKATITSHPEPSDREAITAHPEPSDCEAITFPAHRAAAVIHTANRLPTYTASRAMEGKVVALLSSTRTPDSKWCSLSL